MEKDDMTEPERFIHMAETPEPVSPDYLDDELMIINNVKILGLPGGVRPNMNVLAICTQGKLRISINGEAHEVHERQVFFAPAETTISDLMVSPDFEYTALCITSRALQLYLRGNIGVWNEFVYVRQQRLLDMTDTDMTFFEKLYDLIQFCLEKSEKEDEDDYRQEMMKGILSNALVGLCILLKREMRTVETMPRQSNTLFNQFLDLLQRQEVKHRPVDFYASQLYISPKYLTMVCKKNSGKTAYDWIRESTLADITYELRNTNRSIKEISNRLGFPNTSFFGKYVRDHLGNTPMEYRKQAT